MRTITDVIEATDALLTRHNEGAWDKPFDPLKGGFSSFNDAGIECETGEFLYSLIRLLKPQNVLETGTHIGVGMVYLGLGLKDNRKGLLDTIEFLPELYNHALERRDRLDLKEFVNCYFGDAAYFLPKQNYQLILLDTEPQTRFAEMVRYDGYLDTGGFLFIHDLNRHMGQVGQNPDHPDEKFWPWGEIPEAMKALVTSGKYRPMHFDTPRGLTGFYKVKADDYIWEGGEK